jgi:hypothetical protein
MLWNDISREELIKLDGGLLFLKFVFTKDHVCEIFNGIKQEESH